MKRREYGINLDDGVALSTDEEFRLLYVPCNPETTAHLQGWFADDAQESLMLGGQIGSGKTTLLKEVSRSLIDTHVITVSFDTDPIEALEGGFCMILFGRILQACLNVGVQADGCGIILSDFPSINADSWHSFADKTTSWPSNLQEAGRLRNVCSVMGENVGIVHKACGWLLDRLKEITSREPIIIAEGIDKFNPGSSEYFSLKDTLTFLGKRKTLFEINAIHFFQEQDFRLGIQKFFIGGIGKEMLVEMLKKRLGSYAPVYQNAFSSIIDYSGGNARQALRLLNAYYFRRTQGKNDHTAAIDLARHQVSKDILPYGRFPADVFTVVKRDGYIEGSLLTDPQTMTGANDAVYYNWLFMQDEPKPATPTQWPSIINPLIDEAIKLKADTPRTPEEEAALKWAQDQEISPLDLNLPVDNNGEPAWDKFWEEIESSSFSGRDALNILGLIEAIGAGLFGVERQDRIIIIYQDRKNLEAVRDFLVGEANTYAYFPCEEITIEGGKDREPVVELLTRLADRDPNRIYSVELYGKWTDAQLRDLDHRRDIFDNLQMLWWIQQDDLKRSLRFWPQLRQFFRIYSLEDELWRGITMEEIQADIDFLKDISDESDPEGVRRLSSVLAYLKESGGKS
ncbi:MAG: ATP-binding protein [Desulfobacterales bacterium]|nr:ATP-binding protein [Desulfobacterales bacterium]